VIWKVVTIGMKFIPKNQKFKVAISEFIIDIGKIPKKNVQILNKNLSFFEKPEPSWENLGLWVEFDENAKQIEAEYSVDVWQVKDNKKVLRTGPILCNFHFIKKPVIGFYLMIGIVKDLKKKKHF